MEQFTHVLQTTRPLSKESKGVMDEPTVGLPQGTVVCKGNVFSSSGQQVGGHLIKNKPLSFSVTWAGCPDSPV